MAYREVKVLVLTATPERHNSQPTGFSGRQDATMAPTVTSITTSAFPRQKVGMGAVGYRRFRTRRTRLSDVSVTEIVHSDQATQAAARRLIPPTPRCRCVASTVTTPLYRTTVSQALRQTLRRSFPTSRWTNAQDSPTKEVSDVCLCSWNYSSPYDFLHGDDDLGLASDVGFLEEVEPNDSESLLVVHAPKRKDDHILWAMTVSSPAPDGRVVSVILSSPSFLRLVPCPWVA